MRKYERSIYIKNRENKTLCNIKLSLNIGERQYVFAIEAK